MDYQREQSKKIQHMHKTQALLGVRPHSNYNIIIVGDFNTLLSPIEKSSREKANRETLG